MSNKTFTAAWFTRNSSNWSTLLGHLAGLSNLKCLEIGSFEGRSACWLAENIVTHQTSRLYCVDPFTGSVEHQGGPWELNSLYDRFLSNVKDYGNRIIPIKSYSNLALKDPAIISQTFDFIYIDGAHDAMNVLRDSVLAFDLLKTSGIMIFDDYLWGQFGINTPRMGIDAFLSCYEGK